MSTVDQELKQLAFDILGEAEEIETFEYTVWVKIPRDLWEEFTGEQE
jgi:hypothetical protein